MYARKISYLLIAVESLAFCVDRPGATFLLIPPSARANGMAYAFTAVSDNAYANYYDNAGLAFLESPMFTVTYLGHFTGLAPDQHYAYLALGYPYLIASTSRSRAGFRF
jgi:hypothetical protein